MEKAIELLYQEHTFIKKAIENAQELRDQIENNPDAYKAEMIQYIDFFRKYADGFHHYKEEQILFPEMGKRNEFLSEGVLKEMLDNHEDFRIMLGSIDALVHSGEYKKAHTTFEKYSETLLDHIAVEDDEVFQMAETVFDAEELEQIYFRFIDCDSDLGISNKHEMENKIAGQL